MTKKIAGSMARNKAAAAGAFILLIFMLVALLAEEISPCDPWQMGTPYLRPCREHPLGTNDIGQDILSELIYGTRVSMFIGVVAAVITTVIGTGVGLISGYAGGRTDAVLMAVVTFAIVIPGLPLMIILVAYLHASIWNIIIAICITSWAGTARMIRSQVMQIKQLPFIKTEKALGLSSLRIMVVHILPNIWEIVFIKGTLSVSGAMLSEAGLSFLGLGAVSQKSWGSIIHYAFFRNGVINGYWWWYYPSVVCICLCVMGFVLLGYFSSGRENTEKLMVM